MDIDSGGRSEATTILDDLRRIVQVLRESSRAAEQELGVTGAQLFVLTTLSAHGSLALGELAERTRTHQSTVSVVVKRLVEAGYVRRRAADGDARKLALSLSKRGQSLLARAPLAAQDRLIEGIDRLAANTRQELLRALRLLVENMALHSEEPAMFFEDEPPPPSTSVARRSRGRR